MNRKTFLQSSFFTVAGSAIFPAVSKAASLAQTAPLNRELVKEFVTAGHGNFDRVKVMLEEHPNLIYSRHDWGKGDFEEAIEGAGHVGNAEIANYLISKGARVNLFVLTMLGRTELVKPVLEAYPNLVFANGPHGFSLLHHAMVGGDAAKPLFAYLEEKGLKSMQTPLN